ncbi:MAG: hypothetical protein ACK5B4_11440 [Bacteroidota bacterium]
MLPLPIQKAVHFFTDRPSRLFLLDGIGAILSAALLLLLHFVFQVTNGLPPLIVYALVAAALFLSAYSLTCSWLLRRCHARYLRVIALLNGTYLLTVCILLVLYCSRLHPILIICFILESVVLGFLIYLELKVTNQLIRNN